MEGWSVGEGVTLLLMSPEVLEEFRECVCCWHDAHAPPASGNDPATHNTMHLKHAS